MSVCRMAALTSVPVFGFAVGVPLPAMATMVDTTSITCTNPASGVNWQITIDYQRRTVDSYPASISNSAISWHDAKDGGNYTLDRSSGNLTVIVASSTGGYFLHDQCRPTR